MSHQLVETHHNKEISYNLITKHACRNVLTWN